VRRVATVLALLALGACSKPAAPPVDTCVLPALAAGAAEGTWAGEKARAAYCVKRAAYELARQGGPVDPIGAAALAQCAGAEDKAMAALAKEEGRSYPWERTQLHESLAHTAQVSARQARDIGCGLPPGQQPQRPGE
jgi:hypothetical protein